MPTPNDAAGSAAQPPRAVRQEPIPSGALAKLRQATLTLGTSHLARKGVENVRILNESTFMDIVKGIVGSRDALRADRPGGPPGSLRPPEPTPESERRWRALREKHEDSLRAIEERMGRFSKAFQDLSVALEKLEGERGTSRRGLDLLRQMLLDGEI